MLGGTSHGKTIGGEKLRPYFLHGLIGFNASRISRFIVIYNCFLKYGMDGMERIIRNTA